MDQISSTVHPDYVVQVRQDVLARQFAKAIEGMFYITGYARISKRKGRYVTLFCKPTRAISDALLINREVLVVITKYVNLDPRTVQIIKDIIRERSPQLATEIAIVLHSDPEGDIKLRQWGKEQSIKIVPIYRPVVSARSAESTLRQQLSANLLSIDPFQVTGPVADDTDFFGRKNDALDALRQLKKGRIISTFGMRKIGKTSFINRIISLAKDEGTPRIAMVDCSLDDFSKLRAEDALRVLAKLAKMSASRGYAHVSEALSRTKGDLLPVFSDLWLKEKVSSLAIIFDEIDYITPGSPTHKHWQQDFNRFWREFRVVVQEAQRHGVSIAVLVSGVSSKYFRESFIQGTENSALYFVPDEYLPPFARQASMSMISELGKRCGLQFDRPALDRIASFCADMPFWMRMAGSYIHKSIDMNSRPLRLSLNVTDSLLNEFAQAEGIELVKVALSHLRMVYPEVLDTLYACIESPNGLSLPEGRQLLRYGLAQQEGSRVIVTSDLIKMGSAEVEEISMPKVYLPSDAPSAKLQLSTTEWAEELAVINKRRNRIERDIRQLIRFTLKSQAAPETGKSWVSLVMASLSPSRREELATYAPTTVMDKLYWRELKLIISKQWKYFEQI